MSSLQKKLRLEVKRCDLWNNKHRLLVAFSGGLDSTVLLHLLVDDPAIGADRVVAAHFDHGLRPESADEARQALDFARQLHVKTITETAPAFHAGNLEAWARSERYRFLEHARLETACDRIVTAHHADDQAETLLLRLLRGSGPDGWRSIHIRRGFVVRPLLNVPRRELEAYAAKHHLSFIEDASNQDITFARNRLRHEILPRLDAVQSGAVQHLADAARRAKELKEWLDLEVEQYIDKRGDFSKDFIDLSGFDLWPAALRLAFLRRALPRYRSEISENRWRDLDRWLCRSFDGTRRFPWGNGELEFHEQRLRYLANPTDALPPDPVCIRWNLPEESEGEFSWGDGSFSYNVMKLQDVPEFSAQPWRKNDLFRAWFDADALPETLTLRSRNDGDRLTLPHLGTRRVSDVFIDARIPRNDRNRQPLLVGDDVVWIPGLRRSAQAYIDSKTQRILFCEWMPEKIDR